jgi:hypothetical protein
VRERGQERRDGFPLGPPARPERPKRFQLGPLPVAPPEQGLTLSVEDLQRPFALLQPAVDRGDPPAVAEVEYPGEIPPRAGTAGS